MFHRTPVHIASYVGMSQDAAQAALSRLGLSAHVTQAPSESVAGGTVISQQPSPETLIPPSGVVELIVSVGLPVIEITDLRSFSREDAERYLRNAKLTPKFTEKFDKAPRDAVIAQDPAAGTRVPVRGVVTLTVSKGLSPVATPDIVSLLLSDAVKTLRTRKLDVNVADRQPSDNIPRNVIASQDPKPGTKVDPGTKINVVISTGPAETVVPDVGGRAFDDAMTTMRNSGFVPHIVYLPQASLAAGTVIDQTPSASSTLHHGDAVTLTIAVPGLVPTLAGMPLDQAEKALAAAGYTVGNIAYTQEGVEGKVVRTEPEAGASLRPGEAVSIYYNAPR
jgi:serine/threonine-protein kinase